MSAFLPGTCYDDGKENFLLPFRFQSTRSKGINYFLSSRMGLALVYDEAARIKSRTGVWFGSGVSTISQLNLDQSFEASEAFVRNGKNVFIHRNQRQFA
jgi:hypothetical protein